MDLAAITAALEEEIREQKLPLKLEAADLNVISNYFCTSTAKLKFLLFLLHQRQRNLKKYIYQSSKQIIKQLLKAASQAGLCSFAYGEPKNRDMQLLPELSSHGKAVC